MRAELIAVLAFLLAAAAAVFAIWPVVATPPWEEEQAVVVEEAGDEVDADALRCEAALELRNKTQNDLDARNYEAGGRTSLVRTLGQAEGEIDDYC